MTCDQSSVNEVNVSNTNTIAITNSNNQSAISGNATVSGNTTGGSAETGQASNQAMFETSVNVENQPTCCVTGGGNGGGNNGGNGGGNGNNGGGMGGAGGVTPPAGSTGGSVKGAAVGGKGGGMLPEVGAAMPVDVSALRDAFVPAVSSDGTEAPVKVAQSSQYTFWLVALLIGVLLAGGYGSMRLLQVRRSKL
ncbi:MAG TPA: hypothetical protein VLF67_04770 [Candidatus Saccharimonas sp.]|nr:hypothetical protein [Candidatus Saccharimonas sp.]